MEEALPPSTGQGSKVVKVVLTGCTSRSRAKIHAAAKIIPRVRVAADRQVTPPRMAQQQRRLTSDEQAALCAAYKAGATMRELAERHDVHRTTVSMILTRSRVELRRQGLTDAQVGDASRRYAAGDSCAELARRYQVDPETVRLALRRVGAMPRPAGRPR
jgi:DNA-binding CsgD family transcriptional regulator